MKNIHQNLAEILHANTHINWFIKRQYFLDFLNCHQIIVKYILQNKRGLDTNFSFFLAFFQ